MWSIWTKASDENRLEYRQSNWPLWRETNHEKLAVLSEQGGSHSMLTIFLKISKKAQVDRAQWKITRMNERLSAEWGKSKAWLQAQIG